MREYHLIASPGGREAKNPTHAVWEDDPDFTACHRVLPPGIKNVSGNKPTCDYCWSEIKRQPDKERQGRLAPGNTLLGPLASLLPPVVEDVVIPDTVEPLVIDLSSGRAAETKLEAVWARALWGLTQHPVAPICSSPAFKESIESITRVELVAGTFLVPLPKFAYACLAPFKAMIEQAVQESGIPGATVELVRLAVPPHPETAGPEPESATSPVAEPGPDAPAVPGSVPLRLTDDNRTAIRSLVMSEYNRARGPIPDKEAHNRALAEVARIIEPPCTPEALQEFLNEGLIFAREKAKQAAAEARGPSVQVLMEDWLETHDYLPTAQALAHFGPYTVSAYDQARKRLTDAGYVFATAEGGRYWALVRKPLTPEERLLQDLERARKELDTQIEAARSAVEQQKRRAK